VTATRSVSFCDPNHETVIEFLPSCRSAAHPSKYPPMEFGDYAIWFTRKELRAPGTAARACRRRDRAGRAGDDALVSRGDDVTLPVRQGRLVRTIFGNESVHLHEARRFPGAVARR